MTLVEILIIGVGGFVGTVLRYLITQVANRSISFPVGTLLVNLLGAFLIGFVIGWTMPTWLRYFLIPGFAGALTTFSTVKKEIVEQWDHSYKRQAIFYIVATYLGGILLTALGWWFGHVVQ